MFSEISKTVCLLDLYLCIKVIIRGNKLVVEVEGNQVEDVLLAHVVQLLIDQVGLSGPC